MVLLQKKYSFYLLFLLINQIKFLNSLQNITFQPNVTNNSSNISELINDSIDFQISDTIYIKESLLIEEIKEEEGEAKDNKEEKEKEEEEKDNEEEKGKEKEKVEEEKEEEKVEEEKGKKEEKIEEEKVKEEEKEKEKEEEEKEKEKEKEKEPITEINNTENISPFDLYDGCDNIQPTNGIREDCINYSKKIIDEKKCCYMTINYKYNEFNLCIRIAQDKDEIKKKIKDIEEEYEGCESVNIDCHSNFIELAKYSLLFLSLFVV